MKPIILVIVSGAMLMLATHQDTNNNNNKKLSQGSKEPELHIRMQKEKQDTEELTNHVTLTLDRLQ